ncbi:hypothetical protein XA68_17654 [Ophiocordyceps unilateralis]|uniref:Uncharacterized protein n=1 Tax=Ophiocordyceps unilateralis TaxID=268505 RepID=A0A2A9P4H5_OPHUN|nr:hypothetical protein XA68_17654 [Ophiocordyceps unilateralis]
MMLRVTCRCMHVCTYGLTHSFGASPGYRSPVASLSPKRSDLANVLNRPVTVRCRHKRTQSGFASSARRVT